MPYQTRPRLFTLTPIYSVDDAAKSRSTRASEESVLLVGTNLKCSNASATLATPMTLTYNVDAEITGSVSAKKLVNGLWVNAPFEVNEGTIFRDSRLFHILLPVPERKYYNQDIQRSFNIQSKHF